MTALPLEPHTEAEEATLARFEGAEPAEESAVEKVARAMFAASLGTDDYPWDTADPSEQSMCRVWATAAIEAMKGPSPAEEALVRVEDVVGRLNALTVTSGPAAQVAYAHAAVMVRAAIAAPVAQASGTEAGK